MNRMRSTDRGFNWYAAKWGTANVFNPWTPLSAYTIRCYVRMDQWPGPPPVLGLGTNVPFQSSGRGIIVLSMTTTQNTDVTTTLTREVALALIALAGGVENARGGWNLNGTHYWQTDEALMVALVEIAENDVAR